MANEENNTTPPAAETTNEKEEPAKDTKEKDAGKEATLPRDTVIVHCFEPGKTLPNLSPYVLKLVTYLRMTGIPYQLSTKKPFGPKGKSPWITLNGESMGDSQLIIEFLSKKFEKNTWGNATEEQRATARLVRLALEEHFNWGLANWRWVKDIQHFGNLVDIPPLRLKFMKFVYGRKIKNTMYDVGIGRHSYEELVAMMEEDLQNVSTLLGTKKFILGDEPVEADCAIFGMLAQIVWAAQGSPYEKLLNEKLTNLKEYCIRIKEKYWEDWDKCLSVPKVKEEKKKEEKVEKEKEKEKEAPASPIKEKEKAVETPAAEPPAATA